MRRPEIRFVIVGPLLIAGFAIAMAMTEVRQPIAIAVVGRTNRWSGGIEFRPVESSHVLALVSVTNLGRRPVTYWARGSAELVEYEILRETPQGWKAPGGFRCGTGLTPHTLSPNQGLIFEAVVESNQRAKVEFGYSSDSVTCDVWRGLPPWLQEKLPWWSPWRTAASEPVEFSGSQR